MNSFIQYLTCLFVTGCSWCVSAEIIDVPADYGTIQGAIESAEGGDQIVVAPGTYGESIAFRGKAITVRSAKGAKVTTIDGSVQFQPTVRFEDNETEFAILDGFTIENTSSDGIRIEDGSSPVIRNCRIQNILTTNNAIYSIGWSTVEDTELLGENEYLFYGRGECTRCSFVGEKRDGYGVYTNTTGESSFVDCLFSGKNYGLRIGSSTNDRVVVQGCEFADCYRGLYSDEPVTIEDTIFRANDRSVYLQYNYSEEHFITRCMFIENQNAVRSSIEIASSNTIVEIDECSFIRNPPETIWIYSSNPNITISNSFFCENGNPSINGPWDGENNDFSDSCPDTQGACCIGETCLDLISSICVQANGVFFGSGSWCGQIDCTTPPSEGACCVNTGCIFLAVGVCESIDGIYQGDGAMCEDGCPEHCSTDIDNNGVVNVIDVLAVMSTWGACP